MTANRWLLFCLTILLGLALGLVYGWVISPVQYVDTIPSTLRADFRTDYALMVAEIFESDQDIDQAALRLASLGSQPPAQIAQAALSYARSHNYAPTEVNLLQNLVVALQVWQPPASQATPAGSQP